MHSLLFVFNYRTDRVKKIEEKKLPQNKTPKNLTNPIQNRTLVYSSVLKYFAEISMVRNTIWKALSRLSSQFNNKHFLIKRDRQTEKDLPHSMYFPNTPSKTHSFLHLAFNHHCAHSHHLVCFYIPSVSLFCMLNLNCKPFRALFRARTLCSSQICKVQLPTSGTINSVH